MTTSRVNVRRKGPTFGALKFEGELHPARERSRLIWLGSRILPRPVASSRLGDTPSIRPVPRRLSVLPSFKPLGGHGHLGLFCPKALRCSNHSDRRPALPSDDHGPRRPCARSDVRQRDDGVCCRAMGPALDHGRRVAGAAGVGAATAADRHLRLVRIEGRRPRAGGRIRLQTQAEQEGGGSRRDRAARHAQVDRQQPTARRGSAGRPAGSQREHHARDRPVLRRGDDPHAGGLGGRTRRGAQASCLCPASAWMPSRSPQAGCGLPRQMLHCPQARCLYYTHVGSPPQEPRAAAGQEQDGYAEERAPAGQDAVALGGGGRGCIGNRQGHAFADLVEETVEKNKNLLPLSQMAVALVFGPENGAVSQKLVFEAAKEAYAKSYAHLYVIGFAIQPTARELIEKCAEVVGVPATYVQATPDLLMGDLLKNMRSSQIFSVCGLPEVKVSPAGRRQVPGQAAGAGRFRPGDDAQRHPRRQRRAVLAAWTPTTTISAST